MSRILLIAIVTLLGTTELLACSCNRSGIFKGQKNADIVFKGTVSNINKIVTKEKIEGVEKEIDYVRYEFEFDIKSILKGKSEFDDIKKISLITTAGGADCGNSFDQGKTYLVYSYKQDTKLHFNLWEQKTEEFMTTNLCTRTKKANFFSFFETLILSIF